MTILKSYLDRRLTMRETGVVLLLVVAVAGTGYLAYVFIAAKLFQARVNAAIPMVCADIRDQRQKLVSAIEAYKAHFGIYPPDHVISRQPLVVDAVTNWLVYELAGVTYDPTNHWLQLGRTEVADAKFVKDFFHCDGFTNYGESTNQITHFLPSLPNTRFPLGLFHDDPDVFVLLFKASFVEGIAPQVRWEINPSSWRYVSSSPTNNPGKFDLWLELKTKNRVLTIGNWKQVE